MLRRTGGELEERSNERMKRGLCGVVFYCVCGGLVQILMTQNKGKGV
jgi:hypothetical protein